jgi:hypothetical protein
MILIRMFIFIMTSTRKSSRTIFIIIIKKNTILKVKVQVINDVDEIMQYDNAIDHLLTML